MDNRQYDLEDYLLPDAETMQEVFRAEAPEAEICFTAFPADNGEESWEIACATQTRRFRALSV